MVMIHLVSGQFRYCIADRIAQQRGVARREQLDSGSDIARYDLRMSIGSVEIGRVQHTSMSDQVAAMLRRMVLSRQLAPGERIRQAALAEQLGVSTMPVREALLRLVSEGMVIADVNRSFKVANTTEDGIRDIYWAHSIIAGELTARAVDKHSEALLSLLKASNADYRKAQKADDKDGVFQANWRFHTAINRAADSPSLANVLKNTIRFLPDFAFEVKGWSELAGRWQTGLIKEFTAEDREAAREVVHLSLRKAADLFVQTFWSAENS
jgi:DNA-binding GntR family transcriptional regulator